MEHIVRWLLCLWLWPGSASRPLQHFQHLTWGSAKLAFCIELEKEFRKDRASETSAFEHGFLDLLRTSNTVQVHRQDDGVEEVTVFATSSFLLPYLLVWPPLPVRYEGIVDKSSPIPWLRKLFFDMMECSKLRKELLYLLSFTHRGISKLHTDSRRRKQAKDEGSNKQKPSCKYNRSRG